VNFNVYLDEDAAKRLNRLARQSGMARNKLIREAVATFLERAHAAWPRIVLEFEGDVAVTPFEAHRNELRSAMGDPFSSRSARNGGRHSHAARKR
jgi:hypothetical protein